MCRTLASGRVSAIFSALCFPLWEPAEPALLEQLFKSLTEPRFQNARSWLAQHWPPQLAVTGCAKPLSSAYTAQPPRCLLSPAFSNGPALTLSFLHEAVSTQSPSFLVIGLTETQPHPYCQIAPCSLQGCLQLRAKLVL